MVLIDPTQKKVITLAPDALVFINGKTTIEICEECHARADFNENISSIQVDNEIGNITENRSIKPATASITLKVPIHSPKTFFREGKPVFHPLDEIRIWKKGYFPKQGPGLIPGLPAALSGARTLEYYCVFWGVVTRVIPSIKPGDQQIIITAEDMLSWLDKSNGFRPAFAISQDLEQLAFEPTLSVGSDVIKSLTLNPLGAIQYLLLKFFITYQTPKADGGITQTESTIQPYKTSNTIKIRERINYWRDRFQEVGGPGLYRFGYSDTDVSRLQFQKILDQIKSAEQIREKEKLTKLQTLRRSNPFSDIGNDDSRVSSPLFPPPDQIGYLNRCYDPWFIQNILVSDTLPATTKLQLNNGTKNVKLSNFITPLNLGPSTSILDAIDFFAKVSGFEVYQDMDGKLVVKPPFYNMEVKNNRVQVIKAEEVLSEDLNDNSKNFKSVVYVAGSSQSTIFDDGARQNPSGYVINPRLMRDYGYESHSVTHSEILNKDLCRHMAARTADSLNEKLASLSLTILGRPELLLGYPIYYEPHDAYYYVKGISHNMTFGTSFTTKLTLVAGRRKIQEDLQIEKNAVSLFTDQLTSLNNLYYQFVGKEEPIPSNITGPEIPQLTGKVLNPRTISVAAGIDDKKLFQIGTLKTSSIWPFDTGYWKVSSLSSIGTKQVNASFPIDVVPEQLKNGKFTVLNSKGGKETLPWVFPLSDESGYETFGFFSYGRRLELTKEGKINNLLIPSTLNDLAKRNLGKIITLSDLAKAAVSLNLTGPSSIGLYNRDLSYDTRSLQYDFQGVADGRGSLISRVLTNPTSAIKNALGNPKDLADIKKKALSALKNFITGKTEIIITSQNEVLCNCQTSQPAFKNN